jgi:hypothetical protein
MPIYPSKEEVLDAVNNMVFDKNMKILSKKLWLTKAHIDNHGKRLYYFLGLLLLDNPVFSFTKIDFGTKYYYDSKHDILGIDENNPSLVSTLHEMCHKLYGHDELTAQSKAVAIFKKVFPEVYDKCHFEGHMLKLNKCSKSPPEQ